MQNKLSFKNIQRKHLAENQTPRTSVDFLIDGKSLFEMLGREMDLVGVFSPSWVNNEDTAKIFKMQKLSALKDHRVLIFCCPECGDITCGGITAKIQKKDQDFEWSDFAYENNIDDQLTDRKKYLSVGPFTFAPDEYMKTIDLASTCKEDQTR